MKRNKILESIEEGLLDYYTSLDYYKTESNLVKEETNSYENSDVKYSKLAKNILFRANLATKKSIKAKVISISEASGRLADLDKEMDGNVFPIFKRHVEMYGLAANYRNFDAMTEQEMTNILNQLNLTSLLDDILAELEDE